MSSITAQQDKLDLELVPKENRLDIGKCNGRIPRGLTLREPTFQVVLDAIALTPCYPANLITADVPESSNPLGVYKKQEKAVYYPRFTKVIIHHFLFQEKTLSWRHKIGMHTSKDDYLINSLRFFSAKESTQIYGAILPECLTSLAISSSLKKKVKAYKTYLGYATGVVPPKIARKFKKASLSKKDSDLVPVDKEPVQKGKRVKRPAKKSTNKPAVGVVIREAPMDTKSKNERSKKEELKKTHPSGSGTVAEKPPSVDNITPTITSEGTGDKPRVPDVIEDDSTECESESWGNVKDNSNNDDQDLSNEDSEQENESEEQVYDSEQEEESEDDDQEEEEFVHTPSLTDDKDDENMKSESDEVIKSDEEKGLDDTDYQFDDDVDARLEEPTQTNKEVVQDAHVTNSTVTKKNEVPATSSSRSSDLASKFLNFSDIPHTDAEIVSPLDVHTYDDQLNAELKQFRIFSHGIDNDYLLNSLMLVGMHVKCGKPLKLKQEPQLKSNQLEDRTRQPMAVPISTREPKHNVNQSVEKSSVESNPIHRRHGVSKHMSRIQILTNFVRNFWEGSRGTDLYSITLQDSTSPNPICLMAKATSSQAWLWYRRLSHLNFDTINLLSKNNIVNGLPKLKFIKDHLYSSCELGKTKRKSFHTKTTPSSKRRLQLLHMDLCGPMRVESINGKKYVLVIVDDYSRSRAHSTSLHTSEIKDETP
ncbi:integrase, catalytic region, zinc finger, CCHC-type containing protein [Tanacetum coccineum]